MTRADIVNQIHEKIGIEKIAAQAIVEELMNSIKEHMAEGENIYLRGFGTFSVVERKEKPGRIISNNTSIIIPAHKIPKFKPNKEFKGMIK